MMHSMKVKIRSGEVVINHNSDWSGDVVLVILEAGKPERRVEIPGEVLLAIGKESAMKYVRSSVVEFVEDLHMPTATAQDTKLCGHCGKLARCAQYRSGSKTVGDAACDSFALPR